MAGVSVTVCWEGCEGHSCPLWPPWGRVVMPTGERRTQGPVTLSSVKGRPLGTGVVPAGPSGCPPPTNPIAPFFLPLLGQLVQREEPSAVRGGMGEGEGRGEGRGEGSLVCTVLGVSPSPSETWSPVCMKRDAFSGPLSGFRSLGLCTYWVGGSRRWKAPCDRGLAGRRDSEPYLWGTGP